MQAILGNGKFAVTVSDDVKTGCRFRMAESELDEEVEVQIEAVEGEKVYVSNLIDLVAHELFGSYHGLRLCAKCLKCHVISGKRTYDFTVHHQTVYVNYYSEITRQLEL